VTDVSEVLLVSIITSLMMEVVSTTETSVNLYQITQRNITEDSPIQAGRCENLKYQPG
jgi:hypothetical protein